MRGALSKIWRGEWTPYEKCGKENPEIRALSVLIERNRASLLKNLNEEQKEQLSRYAECVAEQNSLMAEEAFAEGFACAGAVFAEIYAQQTKNG